MTYLSLSLPPSRLPKSIQPRSPCIGIALRHQPPALTGEHYCIRVEITNQEQLPITNLQLVLTLPDSLDEGQPLGTHAPVIICCGECLGLYMLHCVAELSDAPPISSAPQSPERGKQSHHQQGHQVELSCGQLDEGSKFERQVYLCSNGIGARKLDVNVRREIKMEGRVWVNEALPFFLFCTCR